MSQMGVRFTQRTLHWRHPLIRTTTHLTIEQIFYYEVRGFVEKKKN